MASKRRLRRRSCEGKVRHPDREKALTHAKTLGRQWMPYKCPFCHKWHVGRPSRRKIQAYKAIRELYK